MNDHKEVMTRVTLGTSITLLILILILLPMQSRNSAQFVILTLALGANLVLISIITIRWIIMRKKEAAEAKKRQEEKNKRILHKNE